MRAKEQNTWAYRHIGVDWTCPVTDHRKWGKWGTGASCWGGWRRRQQGRNRWCGLPTASKKLRQRVERYLMQRSTHGTHCLPYIAVHWSRQSIRFLATFAPSGLTHVESDSHLRLHERPWRCGPLEPAAGLNRAVRCGALRTHSCLTNEPPRASRPCSLGRRARSNPGWTPGRSRHPESPLPEAPCGIRST
jgi:hypothetical protein